MIGEPAPAADSDAGPVDAHRGGSKPGGHRLANLLCAMCGILLLGVSGCWGAGSGVPGDPWHDEPLDVWFSGPNETSPFVAFHVTQPAYIAIFEIAPQGHVRAIYPYDVRSTQRPVGPGLHAIARFGAERGIFSSCSVPVVYRLIIASEHPLRLDRLRGQVSFALRPALSNFFFASAGFGGTVDRLVKDLVPQYPVGPRPEWATYWETLFFDVDLCSRPGLGPGLLHARAIALRQAWEMPRTDEPTGETGEEEAGPIAPTPPRVPESPPVLEPTETDSPTRAPFEVDGVHHAPSAFRTPEPYRVSDAYRAPVRLPEGRLTEPRRGPGNQTWLSGVTFMPADAARLRGRDRGFPAAGGARSLPSRGFGSLRDRSRAFPSTRTRSTAGRSVQPARGTSRTAPRATGSSGAGAPGGGIRRASGRRKPDGF